MSNISLFSFRVQSILLLAITCVLSSCQGSYPTFYRPEQQGDYGYSQFYLGDSTYRIAFNGNGLTSPETVDRYGLYRAAEVAQENGGTYFEIIGDKGAAQSYTSTSTSINNSASTKNDVQTTSSDVETSSSSVLEHTVIKTIRVHQSERPNTGSTYQVKGILENMPQQLAQDSLAAERIYDETKPSPNIWYFFGVVLAGLGILSIVFHGQ